MKSFFKKHNHKVIWLIFLSAAIYGSGRLYFTLTDGFVEENIVADNYLAPMIDSRSLTVEESNELTKVLDQPFHYLGKGCQSYVFESQDGCYVVKFFKYQRFRPQAWLKAISFIPAIENIIEKKKAKKHEKLTFFREAWKVAFEQVKEASGLVAVHLNVSDKLNKNFILTDKIGFKHSLPADRMEFLIQRKAERLIPWLRQASIMDSKNLLSCLVDMIVAEYQNGISDNDPALMQNTGVYQNKPFHIDVGQFVKDDYYKSPEVWHQELYNKMYALRLYLIKEKPELGEHLTEELKRVIGENWVNMKPFFGRIHK